MSLVILTAVRAASVKELPVQIRVPWLLLLLLLAPYAARHRIVSRRLSP